MEERRGSRAGTAGHPERPADGPGPEWGPGARACVAFLGACWTPGGTQGPWPSAQAPEHGSVFWPHKVT